MDRVRAERGPWERYRREGSDLQLKEAKPPERREFDAFVGRHVFGDPLQGWTWGEVKAEYGWRPHRFWILEGGQTVGCLALLRRELPVFGELLYAPRGPVLDPSQKRLWSALRGELRRIFPAAFAFVAEPRIDEREKRPPRFWQGRRRGHFGGIQPRVVAEIPLLGDVPRIFAALTPKCRYNVRLAGRRGIRVRRAEAPDRATFLRLLQITARRAGFPLRAPRFYAHVLAAFSDAGQGEVFLAEHEGEALAGLFAIRLGRHSLYLYGASADGRRRDMAPYLVQWHAIAWAARGGAERYDMRGIAPNENPRHPLHGLRRFKLQWGAGERRYLGPLDMPLRFWPYLAYRLAEPLVARLSVLRAGLRARAAQ